jgi:hypothetical protein
MNKNNKKILFGSITSIILSGCLSTSKESYQPTSISFDHIYQKPSAIGEIVFTNEKNEQSYCKATLITKDKVLTGRHCYYDPLINQAVFNTTVFNVIESTSVYLPKPSDRVQLNQTSVFYQDASVLSLKNAVENIEPMNISAHISLQDGMYQVSFPTIDDNIQGKDDSNINWQTCKFKPQRSTPALWLSDTCVMPKGYSGMPLLDFREGKWTIVGMYHAYLISRDKKTNKIKKSFGAASPALYWTIDKELIFDKR